MTNEDAVNVLEDMKVKISIPKAAELQRKRNESIDMAIEALNNSEIPNSSDVISRQAAIDTLTEYGNGRTVYIGVEEAVRRIEQLPSAEPKTGHWIRQTDDYHDYYECEHCGIAVGIDDVKNYCPNCGAKMEVEHE